MNDAEYEQQKARVQAVFERWVKPIGLGWWQIDVFWHRDERYGDDVRYAGTPRACAAQCYADWEYMTASIEIYLPVIAQLDDEALEYAILHELAHVFLSEMRPNEDVRTQADAKHEERVATTLAKALIWARKTGYDEGLAAQPERALAEALDV